MWLQVTNVVVSSVRDRIHLVGRISGNACTRCTATDHAVHLDRHSRCLAMLLLPLQVLQSITCCSTFDITVAHVVIPAFHTHLVLFFLLQWLDVLDFKNVIRLLGLLTTSPIKTVAYIFSFLLSVQNTIFRKCLPAFVKESSSIHVVYHRVDHTLSLLPLLLFNHSMNPVLDSLENLYFIQGTL